MLNPIIPPVESAIGGDFEESRHVGFQRMAPAPAMPRTLPPFDCRTEVHRVRNFLQEVGSQRSSDLDTVESGASGDSFPVRIVGFVVADDAKPTTRLAVALPFAFDDL